MFLFEILSKNCTPWKNYTVLVFWFNWQKIASYYFILNPNNQVRSQTCNNSCIHFQEFTTNPKAIVEKFWEGGKDLSGIPAIDHGVEHEDDAIAAFEADPDYGKVVRNGLFVNRAKPMFGASPDGIFGDCLLEIKCPYVMRDTFPNDLQSLTPVQRYRYPCFINPDNHLQLKRGHKYFAQGCLFLNSNNALKPLQNKKGQKIGGTWQKSSLFSLWKDCFFGLIVDSQVHGSYETDSCSFATYD